MWTRHVLGRVVQKPRNSKQPTARRADLQAIRNRCPERVDIAALYRKLTEQGRIWSRVSKPAPLWRGTTETLAEIILADSLRSEAARYRFHPALLDACFQAAVQALPERSGHDGRR